MDRGDTFGEMSGLSGSMMGLKNKPRINLTKNLKLINRSPNFIFKFMNFSCSISYGAILTHELLNISTNIAC